MELASRGFTKTEGVVDRDLAAGIGELSADSAPPLPTDFIAPTRLLEKPYQGTTKFMPMYQPYDGLLPDRDPTDTLRDWIWQDGRIKFVGATVPVTVRIEYIKNIMPITSSGSSIDAIAGARNYLAFKGLTICGLGRADTDVLAYADRRAQAALDKILDAYTTGEQFTPLRRVPYGVISEDL